MNKETQQKNVLLWDTFEATDPAYTKRSNVSGQQRVSADAQYKKKQITKAFGPMGKGWGVIAESEKYERINYEGGTTLLNYTATAFYLGGEQHYTFPIAAGIKEAFITQGGKGYLKIDEEAIKKVRTDALTKGFTDLGFCSDIHMGKFDDDTYVTAAYAKSALEKEENADEAFQKAKSEIDEWAKTEVAACISLLPKSINGFKGAMAGTRKKLLTRCAAVGINSKAYTDRIDQIVTEELAKLEGN